MSITSNDTIDATIVPRYMIVHDPKDPNGRPCVLLMEAPYKGVIVKIGALKFDEYKDTMRMSFEKQIIDPANFKPRKLKKDKAFTKILGDIIVTLMAEQIDELEAMNKDGT